jgi:hypothetical protein
METNYVDEIAEEQNGQLIQEILLECQIYDMMYAPYIPTNVDYMPALREIGSALKHSWQRFFSGNSVNAIPVQEQTSHG